MPKCIDCEKEFELGELWLIDGEYNLCESCRCSRVANGGMEKGKPNKNVWSFGGSPKCDACKNRCENCPERAAKKTFLLEFAAHDLGITLDEIVIRMSNEDDKEKRKKLQREYEYYDRLLHFYRQAIELNEESLSWDTILEEGRCSLANLAMFKKCIVEAIGLEKWHKAVEREYQYKGKESVEEYLRKVEETGDIYS